jgi:glycosyltransferase involved in cell wall biosynthesis
MKVSYVHGVCVKYDAISNCIRDGIRILQGNAVGDVRLYTYCCEYEDLPFTGVNELRDVVFDPHFQSSDLVVFHFGVFCPLFNLLPLSPRRAKRLVVFHNITPAALVSPEMRGVIEKSFAQMSNIMWADHVACDSDTNLEVLRAAGIQTPATVLPLAVHAKIGPPAQKPSFNDKITRIAFVGRIVRSKGVGDLLEAVHHVAANSQGTRLLVDFVGNMMFSDTALVKEAENLAGMLERQFGQRVAVNLHGDATEEAKRRILRDADLFVLPSYHEGFCVPIIEAIASGCRVVAYGNSNIPAVSGGLATLVATGNVESLSMAVHETIRQVSSVQWRGKGLGAYEEYARVAARYVDRYSPRRTSQNFLRLVSDLTSGLLRN